MLISHRHNFITIDIPKTGSRTLRQALTSLNVVDKVGGCNDKYYQHITARELKSFVPINWNDYYIFTLVRNPWDRYWSLFKYYHNYKEKYQRRCESIKWREPEINQGNMCVKLFNDRSYEQVFEDIIKRQKPQHEYYLDKNNNYIVSHIGMFENYENEIKKFLTKLGKQTPEKLTHENKSDFDMISKKDIFTDKIIDLVYMREKHIILTKSYEFDYE